MILVIVHCLAPGHNILKIILSVQSYKVVQLDGVPDNVGTEKVVDLLLRYGTEVEIPSISGSPKIENGEVQDPLTKNKFDISFVGIDGAEVTSKVKIARKIWFSGTTV